MSEEIGGLGRILTERIAESLKTGSKMQNSDITTSTVEVKRGRYCRHAATVIDEDKRSVSCNDCGAIVDPIDVLVGYSRRDKSMKWSSREADRINARIEELKKEEKRIKSRISSAKKRAENYPTLAAVKFAAAMVTAINEVHLLVPRSDRGDKRMRKAIDEAGRLAKLAGLDGIRL